MTANTSVADATVQTSTPVSNENAAKASLRKIDALIGTIRKGAAKLITDVQDAIIMIAIHAKDEGRGDVSRLAMLMDALPEAVKRAGLKAHVEKYSSMRLTKNAKTGLFNAHLAQEVDAAGKATGNKVHVTAAMIDALRANNWFDDQRSRDTPNEFFTMDAIEKVDNLVNFLDRRLKSMRKNPETGQEVGPFVESETERNRIRDLANALRGVSKSFTPDEIAKREALRPLAPSQEPVVRTGTDG